MWDKLRSRKFWVAVGGVLATLATAAGGQITWAAAIPTVMNIVLGYLAAEGAVDIARAVGKKK